MTQPPPDYDVNDTVVTEVRTQSADGLSPTLRMLLIALGILALAGLAWWLFQRAKPAPIDPTQTTISTPGTPGAGTTPGGTNTGTSTDSGGGTANVPPISGSGSNTEVTAPGGGTLDPANLAPKPEGINPDQPLSGLNGSNPFKTSATEGATGSNGTGNNGATTAMNPGTTPSNQPSQDTSSSNGGQLGNNSGTTSAGPVTITRPQTPPSAIDAAINDSGTKNPGNVTSTVKPPTALQPPRGGNHTTSGTHISTGTANNGAGQGAVTTNTPIVPPIAGVALPKTNTSSMTAGSGNTAANSGAALLPNPGIPTALGSVGDTAPAPATGTETSTSVTPLPDTSAIDAYLSTNQIALNAVVLGPTNTAILKTKQGFVVATVGQPITGSDIVLKSVTADSATLSVGNQTKTIPLENKVSHE